MAFFPVRRVRNLQPQRVPKIDYANPITKDIVFAFEASIGQRDLAGSVAGSPLLSGVSIASGQFGRHLNFSGAQADGACSFGLHKGISSATAATWDILVYFDAANPTAHFFSQWDLDRRWLLQASGGSLIWVAAQDDVGNRTRWDASALFPSSGWYRITASWLGGSSKVLVVNGVDRTSSLSFYSANATRIGPTINNDKLQIGQNLDGTALAGNVCFARVWKRGMPLSECLRLHARPWQIFNSEVIPLFLSTATAQFLRPISDVSNSGWTPSAGSDLFACIGETVRNDSTYISATAPGAICEVLLGISSGDPLSSINHLPRIVMSAGSGGIILRLKQGATLIKAWTYAALAGSDTLYEPTLTSGEIDAISDYTDLRLEMETTA